MPPRENSLAWVSPHFGSVMNFANKNKVHVITYEMNSKDISEAKRLLLLLSTKDFEGLLDENLLNLKTRAKGNPLTNKNVSSFLFQLASSVLQLYTASGLIENNILKVIKGFHLKGRLMYVYNTLSKNYNVGTFDTPTTYLWDVLDSLVARDIHAVKAFAQTFRAPLNYQHNWIRLNTNALLYLIDPQAGDFNSFTQLKTAKFSGKFQRAFSDALNHLNQHKEQMFWSSLKESIAFHRQFMASNHKYPYVFAPFLCLALGNLAIDHCGLAQPSDFEIGEFQISEWRAAARNNLVENEIAILSKLVSGLSNCVLTLPEDISVERLFP